MERDAGLLEDAARLERHLRRREKPKPPAPETANVEAPPEATFLRTESGIALLWGACPGLKEQLADQGLMLPPGNLASHLERVHESVCLLLSSHLSNKLQVGRAIRFVHEGVARRAVREVRLANKKAQA